MGYDEARLLLTRTRFAASEREIAEFAALSREQAVEQLLRTAGTPQTPAPAWAEKWERPPRLNQLSDEERRAYQRELVRRNGELRGWWLREMLASASPLTEKMTVFWHNHFVSSMQKVRAPQLMYRQNLLLRKHALGNFGELLHAVAKDPAMIIYLDGATNRKGEPNENFAREVMELFTLGEGHYGEQDVKQAARAFTGWGLDLDSGEFRARPALHDEGVKTVLGKSGNFDGAAVLDILLARPECAAFIVAKLWREFVSPVPDRAEVERIAARFRDSGYDIKAALRALLTADALYAPANRASLTKSPVDLVVGTLRQFNFEIGEPAPFVVQLRNFGQDLFAPPNVRGWVGGDRWINSSTLLARKQLLERLFDADVLGEMQRSASAGEARDERADGKERPPRPFGDMRFDSNRWLAQFEGADSAAIDRLLLPAAAVSTADPATRGIERVRGAVLDPVYQLK